MFDTAYSLINEITSPDAIVKQFEETQNVQVRKCINGHEINYYYGFTDADTVELKMSHNSDNGELYVKVNFVAANGELYKVRISTNLNFPEQPQINPEILMDPIGIKYIDRNQTHLNKQETIALISRIGQKFGEIVHNYGFVADEFKSPGRHSHGYVYFRSIVDSNELKRFVCIDYNNGPSEADYDEVGENVGMVAICIFQETNTGMIEHCIHFYINEEYLLAASDEMLKHVI